MIYLDHAATSWPKPPEVLRAMVDFLELAGGNPGRSGHRLSIAAGRIVYQARESVAELFHAPDPLRVIFTLNVTHALNLALRGLLRPGDRVVTSSVEHNSVMRPLRDLERQGIELTVMPCRADGTLDLAEAEKAIRPGTRLVVLTHASNVIGTLLPVSGVAALAHRAGALLLVDAAQTAGCVPIDVQEMGIDLLAITGHKALLGPPGTGGLVLGPGLDPTELDPLYRGGTGSRSRFELQPEELPDKFEAGTPNGTGIAGLGAAVSLALARSVQATREHDVELTQILLSGLRGIPGVAVYGTSNPAQSTPTVSFTIHGQQVSDVGLRLDDEFGVLSRVGLHCAPAAHRTIGTFPHGTVRFSAGLYTSEPDVEAAVRAVSRVASP